MIAKECTMRAGADSDNNLSMRALLPVNIEQQALNEVRRAFPGRDIELFVSIGSDNHKTEAICDGYFRFCIPISNDEAYPPTAKTIFAGTCDILATSPVKEMCCDLARRLNTAQPIQPVTTFIEQLRLIPEEHRAAYVRQHKDNPNAILNDARIKILKMIPDNERKGILDEMTPLSRPRS